MTKPRESAIASPCVSICALNDNDICIGCYRSADEISSWSEFTNQEKQAVLVLALEREKAVNPFL